MVGMAEPSDEAREHALREVERAMMYIAQARRKAEQIAGALAADGAEDRYVDALRTAAAALNAEHNRLLNSTHFVVPDEPLTEFPPEADDEAQRDDQQRMAL